MMESKLEKSKFENLGITNITIVIKILGNLGGIDSSQGELWLISLSFYQTFNVVCIFSGVLGSTNVNETFTLVRELR